MNTPRISPGVSFFSGVVFSHINHFAHLLVQFVIEIVITSSLRWGTPRFIFRAELDVENCHYRTNHHREQPG